MQAKDIMTTSVVTVGTDTSVGDIAKILVRRRISAVPVVDAKGRIVGIVSEGDLMRRPESGTERKPSWWLSLFGASETRAAEFVKSHGLKASDVMTRNVVTAAEDSTLAEIATKLETHHIKRVPILKAGKPVGIVSRANLLHGLVAKEKSGKHAGGDAAIRRAIIDGIREAGINDVSVNVVVTGGKAQIWGAVEADVEREAVRVAAAGVPGVKGVENNVAVVPLVQTGSWA